MATVGDLTTQLEAALGALSTPFVVLTSGTLEQIRIARSDYAAAVRVASSERLDTGSNQSVTLVSIEVDLMHRAAGSSPAQMGTAEDAHALLLVLVADASFWSGLAAVRSSPLPDISLDGDLTRVGEVLSYTVRAECALEA
tara:strand:+ start:1105 stop:1527 length:423 start_codon:yes stop_codon:yes gene_type:complete